MFDKEKELLAPIKLSLIEYFKNICELLLIYAASQSGREINYQHLFLIVTLNQLVAESVMHFSLKPSCPNTVCKYCRIGLPSVSSIQTTTRWQQRNTEACLLLLVDGLAYCNLDIADLICSIGMTQLFLKST